MTDREQQAFEAAIRLRLTFCTRMAARRVSLGLSQSDLAKAVGLSRAQITNLEAARGFPTLERAVAVAAALDCSLSYLIGEKNKP